MKTKIEGGMKDKRLTSQRHDPAGLEVPPAGAKVVDEEQVLGDGGAGLDDEDVHAHPRAVVHEVAHLLVVLAQEEAVGGWARPDGLLVVAAHVYPHLSASRFSRLE